MKKIVCFGELMLSLEPDGYRRFVQADEFHVFYTGAESNVCASLAQFGMNAQFVTRLPENEIADSAVASLRRYGIGTDYIVRGGDRIGVIYTERGASQRPSKVIYDRKHTAISESGPETFDWEAIFRDADWFHFTGITPALSDSVAEACLLACKTAKRLGVRISCDLNFRKKLWNSEKAGRVMSELLAYVDVLIANEEDVEKVLGICPANTDVTAGRLDCTSYADVAQQLSRRFGMEYVATTLRKSISASDNDWSAMLYHNGNTVFSREYHIHIVNRVGGGDSFAAALIYAMLNGFDEQKTVEFAAAASCLKHTIEDDYNLVSVDEVMTLMNGDGSGRVQR